MILARNVLMTSAIFVAASVVAWQPSIGTAKEQQRLTAAEQRGLALANAQCSACHAVIANKTSPLPNAPSFQDIANRPEVTGPTLREFLSDSHNYPTEMNFQMEDEQIEGLAEYIVTLQRPNYRPVL